MIINLMNNVENKKEELLVKVSEKDSSILLKNHNLDPEEYQDITKEKIENIKFSLTSSVKNTIVLINYMQEELFITVGGKNYSIEIPLESIEKERFDKEYKGKIFYCICTVKYTKEWDTLSLHNIKPLNIQKSIKKWRNHISKFPTPMQKIDEVIKILGLNPISLLSREKIIIISRLLPIAVKRYILMDFGPKKRGKTTTYKKFGIHGKSFANTRASIVFNNSNKSYGAFFNTLYDVFLIDEVQDTSDPELWTFLQIYSDGNRGEIIFSPTNVMQADVSVVLLGNPGKNVDFTKIFADKINIFENTGIPAKKGESGAAKLSRIDSMLYSGGCRNISPDMHLPDDAKIFPKCIFKQALLELREEKIDIKNLVTQLNLPMLNDDRIEISVHKTFEGFLKILYPEFFIENYGSVEISQSDCNGISFLYYLAIELKKVVENTVNILNEQESPGIFQLSSDKFFWIEEIINPQNLYFYAPHRIIITNNTGIVLKKPLDTVGIKQNEDEYKLLNLIQNKGINCNCTFDGITLQHNSNITYNNVPSYLPEIAVQYYLSKINNYFTFTTDPAGKEPALFDHIGKIVYLDEFYRPMLQNEQGFILKFEDYGGFNVLYNNGFSILRDKYGNIVNFDQGGQVQMPFLYKLNPYWNKGIFYNYLVGEEESQRDRNFIRNFTFYDIAI